MYTHNKLVRKMHITNHLRRRKDSSVRKKENKKKILNLSMNKYVMRGLRIKYHEIRGMARFRDVVKMNERESEKWAPRISESRKKTRLSSNISGRKAPNRRIFFLLRSQFICVYARERVCMLLSTVSFFSRCIHRSRSLP